MSSLLVGDVHADHNWLTQQVAVYAERKGHDRIICVGDFGYTFSDRFLNAINRAKLPIWFLRGNHDDTSWIRDRNDGVLHGEAPVQVEDNLTYLPDGCTIDLDGHTAMCFGGAVSIDKRRRVEHVSWWRDETLTEEGWGLGMDANPDDVDLVLSHDCPPGIGAIEDILTGYKDDPDSTYHRYRLGLLRRLEPSAWVHGHYHWSYSEQIGDCSFLGLDMNGSPLKHSTAAYLGAMR